jgi:hypothetical protein
MAIILPPLPAAPTGDYELDGMITAYHAGRLDDDGVTLLAEALDDPRVRLRVRSHHRMRAFMEQPGPGVQE